MIQRPISCRNCQRTSVIFVVDRNLDCVTGFVCESCGHEWKRDLGEVLAHADEAAFDEPKREASRGR